MPRPRNNLAFLIIAKALIETLFVVSLVLSFHYRAFNTRFSGRITEVNGRKVTGWVFDEGAPSKPIEVQLYLNDQFVASRIADHQRRDSVNTGDAVEDAHEFEFDLSSKPVGEYEARVYVVQESGGGARRTLQTLHDPVRFRVGAK
ncbi:MAG: hypothetical protein H0V88_13900 [Pyrinomonadaceae bacterium]|nr:hypothetical protein [Pyrinomonadaceae bacterium]